VTSSEFTLPDVGEGLTEAEIVSWKVKAGDEVVVNQVLVEIETAKSLVELPSPFAGTVTAILVAEGSMVDVGTPIISVSSGTEVPSGTDAAPLAAPLATESGVTESGVAESGVAGGAVLVGYGIKGHVGSRRNRPASGGTSSGAGSTSTASGIAASAPAIAPRPIVVPAASASAIIAKPPIRKLAKDLSVTLSDVTPTGVAGEITREDVVRQASQGTLFRNIETPAWGSDREERLPVKGVRKVIAAAMVSSAFTAPHVSLFVDVDATRTMEFVKRLKNSTDFAGVKVSPLLMVAKAMIWAVRRNPTVNAQWTDSEIIVKHFVNFGIAAATPRGLIVPNIKEAQELSLRELASAIEQLTITARDGKTSPADQAGGTITVTNIGVFGMDTGTPILNPGEVAILALGTIKQKPWVVDGEVRPRFVTTLGASFDHRVVDGDVASRFLADVASVIEEPALLLD
jgi:2-oxoisovalerate dehydrogenase E2 component (dihydrolipoyl transacylase)